MPGHWLARSIRRSRPTGRVRSIGVVPIDLSIGRLRPLQERRRASVKARARRAIETFHLATQTDNL